MRLASYTLLILGAVTAAVLATSVRKLTLQDLDKLAKKNGKLMIEWNVAACVYVKRKKPLAIDSIEVLYSFSPMAV